ncbi:MAG: 50S ribosomal protein L21e [Candidatus Hydrothermarchaeota archaeon]|jgi:large subunit ribosomal protein L21e|nr:50S ribosomal protein L21e [Candidatus Hydrothermarchaeota archaeon]
MERSRGFRSKTRHKMKKPVRKRGELPVSRLIQEFNVGDTVSIVMEPSVQKGQPHPRFHGKTGVVREKRGRSYLVEISDGNAKKKVISRPVHLFLQR